MSVINKDYPWWTNMKVVYNNEVYHAFGNDKTTHLMMLSDANFKMGINDCVITQDDVEILEFYEI